MRLIDADVVRSEFFDRPAEVAGELVDDLEISLDCEWSVVPSLKLVQHHLP
jgi:hypothetical protein